MHKKVLMINRKKYKNKGSLWINFKKGKDSFYLYKITQLS
jgi:hypothetical protein